MSTENLYRRDGRRFVAVEPDELAERRWRFWHNLFSKMIDWAIVAMFAFAALVIAWKLGAASMLPDPQPAPLLPHAAIEIPAPLDLPKWETPAPVFYHFYALPPAPRGINFNGNTR